MTTTYENKSKVVTDERIAKYLLKSYAECERIEKPFDHDKACRTIAKRLGVDIDRVERVCECVACGYYGEE